MHAVFVRRSTVGRLFYFWYRILVQPFMDREVSSFSAITQGTRDYLAHDCRVTKPIKVMPLGVDTDIFHADIDARSSWRSAHGFNDNELVVLYVGKVIRAKGLDVLVGAAIRCLDAGQQLRVVMVGDADEEYVARIRQQIATGGRDTAFLILPSVPYDALPELYAAADACVWPRQESMSVLEGMAMSLPVVVSESSGNAAMVRAGAGLTFRQDDEAALTQVLVRLRDRELRHELGLRGRSQVEKEFTWRRSADRYIAEYARVRSVHPNSVSRHVS
jgi:glycosyltransferase involved in cell wall biosynthesis